MYEHGMITPVVALVIWSLIMLIWLYATRIPAMSKAKLKPGQATKSDMEALPSANVANNYNHLMEQPTLFYATCVILALAGAADLDVKLGWAYVALRVAHSLWQSLVNTIPVRFTLFALSSLALAAMAVRAVLATTGHG